MQVCNILIGCDQSYYSSWGEALLKSIYHYNPWIALHCHIVNPSTNFKKLKFINYTFENINFENEDSKIGYLQAVRFIVADKFFNQDQYVMTLDADTICTKKFSKEDFFNLFNKNTVLQHPKDGRWLAGLVCLGPGTLRTVLAKKINDQSIENWKFGRDQDVLAQLAAEYKFQPVSKYWLSIGKNGLGSVFLTLKGNQKYTEKYLDIYNRYIIN